MPDADLRVWAYKPGMCGAVQFTCGEDESCNVVSSGACDETRYLVSEQTVKTEIVEWIGDPTAVGYWLTETFKNTTNQYNCCVTSDVSWANSDGLSGTGRSPSDPDIIPWEYHVGLCGENPSGCHQSHETPTCTPTYCQAVEYLYLAVGSYHEDGTPDYYQGLIKITTTTNLSVPYYKSQLRTDIGDLLSYISWDDMVSAYRNRGVTDTVVIYDYNGDILISEGTSPIVAVLLCNAEFVANYDAIVDFVAGSIDGDCYGQYFNPDGLGEVALGKKTLVGRYDESSTGSNTGTIDYYCYTTPTTTCTNVTKEADGYFHASRTQWGRNIISDYACPP